ncbi:hypothetical protein RHSIM_Rhsim10G0196600 [Rhododendron simsii]|uniref:PHD finger protein MALE STERILITY 1-like ubiquitin-like domain-containing protein n=1 Tax=Rhododendron simsii TaxID=118357 RepID=A0A834GAW6_RHOSS|nr:hypothetical protein RHSIM_Rhsim10G0196600 [Rhododendron simsii]
MDFRLLHGVAYGHTWFGRWGYRFCNGSFGITQTKYEEAVHFVSSLQLENMMNDDRNPCLHKSFKRIIRYYQSLSETSLITIRDLLRFSLTLTSTVKFNKKSTSSKPFYQHLSRISNMAYRLENLTDLEVINKATEYWEILLNKILRNYPAAKASVQIILDTDCFAKAWVGESDQYICRLVSNFVDTEDDVQNGGVGEVIVLQLDSAVGDLKVEIRNAMRDTYFGTENLEVTEIEGMEGVEDCKVLAPELVKHRFEIRFKGSCLEAPEVANDQGKSPLALNHQGDEKV